MWLFLAPLERLGDGLTVHTMCDAIVSISLLLSCVPKQVFLNIFYVGYKVTGEVEKEHFQCLLNDVGFNNSHCYSYRGEWGCVGGTSDKALILAAILQHLWSSTRGN